MRLELSHPHVKQLEETEKDLPVEEDNSPLDLGGNDSATGTVQRVVIGNCAELTVAVGNPEVCDFRAIHRRQGVFDHIACILLC